MKPEVKLNNGYCAALDDQTFDAVRRDPGVEYIEDEAVGEVESKRLRETLDQYQAPYHAYEPSVPGVFLVSFRPGYTLAEHSAYLGGDLKLRNQFQSGYCAVLDDQTVDAVRRDPGVKYIEDNTSGELE